jgi:hypothetical protein
MKKNSSPRPNSNKPTTSQYRTLIDSLREALLASRTEDCPALLAVAIYSIAKEHALGAEAVEAAFESLYQVDSQCAFEMLADECITQAARIERDAA